MCTRLASLRWGWALGLFVGSFAVTGVRAQEVLHLYGPVALSPAIEEAAVAFGARNDVKIDVASDPVEAWPERLRNDGDLVYSTGEFVMSELVRERSVPLDRTSVTPLYVRSAVILVRPDNPKDVRDFPDLLRPGMKVMLVNESGQTGLWENMTGKLQSLQNLVALQKNIVLCAKSTGEAMQSWEEKEGIDAWLTWNVWHMPRRDSAQIVPVSKDYQIYRACSISLTQRGTDNPLANQFVEFLASREGTDIFNSWGWSEPPADAAPAIAERGVCVACRIKNDQWTSSVGRGLGRVQRLVREYQSLGVPGEDIHICAVFDGEAGYWMLKDGPYQAFTGRVDGNPNKGLVAELVTSGVSVELSAKTMKDHGWTPDDVLPGVAIVPDASPRIADLGRQGYDYLPF